MNSNECEASKTNRPMNRKLLVTILLVLTAWSGARADQEIESAQEKLKDQGFYYGEITGTKDTDTTAAIRRYQIRNGLQITGELNAETLRSLGLNSKPAANPPPPPARTPAPKVVPAPRPPAPQPNDTDNAPEYAPAPRAPQFESTGLFDGTPYQTAPLAMQREVIIKAQTLLTRLGYYREEIDGAYGPGMNFALRNYQARFGIRPTGRLDVETLASLSLLPGQRTSGYRRSPRFFPPRPRLWPSERVYVPR
jgi:peptidoglycan hydrolase-like protein with peptidoglycan-binding domain